MQSFRCPAGMDCCEGALLALIMPPPLLLNMLAVLLKASIRACRAPCRGVCVAGDSVSGGQGIMGGIHTQPCRCSACVKCCKCDV